MRSYERTDFKVDPSGTVRADDDLKLVIPTISTRPRLDTTSAPWASFRQLVRPAEEIHAHFCGSIGARIV